jgi:hypothetical protein
MYEKEASASFFIALSSLQRQGPKFACWPAVPGFPLYGNDDL